MSSSTTDTTSKEQESQDQTVPSDIETSKLASLRSETSEADSLAGPDLTFTMDQPPVSDQSTPDKDSCFNDATPSVEDAHVGLQQQEVEKTGTGSRETEPSAETLQMEQVTLSLILQSLELKQLYYPSIKYVASYNSILGPFFVLSPL